jgi:L-lactate dehydrogenase complex protein LldG
MTTRSEFLEQVRAGLGKRDPAIGLGAAPAVDDRIVRLTQWDKDLADVFAARADSAGLSVHRCGLNDAAATLRSLLTSFDAGRIVLDSVAPGPTSLAEAAIAGLGAQVFAPRVVRSLDAQFDADVGITGVFAAIAETGTLVVASDEAHSRGTFIIPPVHLAIVLESQIIADMMDLWPRLGTLPTALTLISGPSKTADIEGILVTGVHGPGAVHVLLIADRPNGPRTRGPQSQGEQP